MTKNILVALPLTDELQTRLRAAVPSFAYRFTTQETATLERSSGQMPSSVMSVRLIRQTTTWNGFQSNFAA